MLQKSLQVAILIGKRKASLPVFGKNIFDLTAIRDPARV
jgi:hypothetical protein